MSSKCAKNLVVRTGLQMAFVAVSLLIVGRVLHLAATGSTAELADYSSLSTAGESLQHAAGTLARSQYQPPQSRMGVAQPVQPAKLANRDSAPQAELESLYRACPMAAIVDLQTVTTDPARIDQLLPPYQPMVHRVPALPVEPAIPRIRYPISIGSETPRHSSNAEALRIAAAPQASPSDKATSSQPSQSDSQFAAGKTEDWLIDPEEWYTSGDKKADSQPTAVDPKPEIPQAKSSAAPLEPTTDSNASPPSDPAPAAPPIADAAAPPVPSAPSQAESSPSPPADPVSVPPTKQIFAPPPVDGSALPHPVHGHNSSAPLAPDRSASGVDPHLELFTKNNFPSARECAQCHEEIYKDWAISAHAYAAVSPMFQKFEQKLNDLSNGTVGYFCIRCHAPVATALCASRAEPLWSQPEAVREGITCIACHRVQYAYGKANGERRVETGDIFAPVLGGIGGDGVAEAIQRKDEFKLKTPPADNSPGQNIHVTGVYFQTLTRSEFCTPCHQVAVHPGIKLEVVWEQYRASPACKKGIQCQDCHMGKVPGVPLGYDCGPVAKVSGKTINNNRKKSSHVFYGPNYPIAHPGIFPFHLKANRWTMEQWLMFDWRAGWGTKEFEKAVDEGRVQAIFPPVWAEADDRFDAREIIDDNIKQMERKRDIRVQVMENGSHVDGPFFDSELGRGHDLKFHYVVTNKNDGHNLLTASLGAQPQLWANVVMIGPDGRRIWETGYTDSNNDVANIHSVDVRNHRISYDKQLFNLQTMFLVQGATGTDREFYVPVNFDFDQLPFIRPGVQPITTLNHPPGIRMESRSLPPLGSRKAHYHVPGHLIQQPGRYRLAFRLRSRSEPIYFMRFCEATPEMERMENEWMIDIHPMSVEFEVR